MKWGRKSGGMAVMPGDHIIGLLIGSLIEKDVGQCRQINRASHRRRLILQFQQEVAVVLLLASGVQR